MALGRPSPYVLGGAIVATAIILLAALLAHPSGPEAAEVAPDLPPLELDGQISEAELAHDSRDDLFRVPFGSVPAGTVVTLRLRAAAGDLSQASVRVYDALAQSQLVIEMDRVARDATAGEHGYDYWQTELHTTLLPTVLYYRFIVRDGPAARYVEDDPALDGGAGTVLNQSADASWQIVTHDPDFTTPDWSHGATAYQIFPDRFANGDPANDPSPDATAGSEGAARYRYGDVYGNPILVKGWDELPEGHCRAYQGGGTCDEQPLGRDFFGGDLAGIIEHLDELADLGVTVLYLNPVFAAPSNHRYDTSDYFVVDPDLGSNEDLSALVDAAHERGLRLVLDGVFNHTSSDSPFFDRAGRFAEVGACESADSPYAAWYTLQPGPPAKCFGGQTYLDWFGFDTLPVLTENPPVTELVNGEDGIVRTWLEAGIDGWRLDVMNEISHPFLRALSRTAHEANPDALILGEEWGDASAWLLGDEADTVMNYRFRRAVIGLVNGATADPDGEIAGLTPSQFASVMDGVREDYPPAAFASLFNLVDSHDTARILWTLTPAADNREDKESPEALATGKARLQLVAAIQLTWPGMASIYYGDEAGLTGHDDPDDRRPYPWGAEDAELRDHYRTLAGLRRENAVFAQGDLRFLLTDDAAGVLAFGRRTDEQAAVTVLNIGETDAVARIPVAGWLPDGTPMADALGGPGASVEGGELVLSLPALTAAVLLTDAGVDLAPLAAPADIVADAATGQVALRWGAVEDATSYTVWRSIVSGGGYQDVGTAEATNFEDDTVRNGVRYYYVVMAADDAGNAGSRSAEVQALPEVIVADARLDAPAEVTQPLSAVEPGTPIGALVRTESGGGAGPTVGIDAELGVGRGDAEDPLSDPGWSWSPMRYEGDAGDTDRFAGEVRPVEAGDYRVALRVSTDGGESWQLAGLDGLGWEAERSVALTATPADDREAPPAPRDVVASVVSEAAVTLIWEPVAVDDLFGYEILRGEAGGALERIATAEEPTYTDDTVAGGGAYVYRVVAVDTSYNRSDPSNEITTAAEAREVAVTFTVTVPAYTPAGDSVHIAGDFQGWDPGATPMTRVDAVTWTITVPFAEGAAPQYKYTRGSWEAVEKDDGCGEIPNRSITVVYGEDGTWVQLDGVGKWRDVDNCP